MPGGRDATLLLIARVSMSSQRALVGVIVSVYLAQLGFSALKLSVLFVIVAVASTLMSAGIGAVADQVGRKPFLIALPLITSACAVAFAVTRNEPVLFVTAAIGSFGRGSGAGGGQIGPYTPAEQALMAGLVPDRQRPRLFGLVASASAMGGLIGSGLSALPVGHAAAGPIGPETYRSAYLAAAILAAIAGVLAIGVHEPMVRRRDRPARRPLSSEARSLVARLWAVNATNGVAVGLFGPFITYWLYRQYGVGTADIGTLYVIVNAVTFVTNFAAAPVAARIGVVRTVVIARIGQGLLLIPFALAPTFFVAGGVYLLRSVVQRFGMAMRQSFVMTAAPAPDRARVGAYSQIPTQALSAAAPTLTGYLFDEVSLTLPFELGGVLQLANALLFWHFFHGHDASAPAGADTSPAATVQPRPSHPPGSV